MKSTENNGQPASGKNHRLMMMMCQFRPTPSNPLLNAIAMVSRMARARKKGARLVMFGETALQGYSIFDELKNPDFYHQSEEGLDLIRYAADTLKIGVIIGTYRQNVKHSEKWANNSLYCYIPPGIPRLQPQVYIQDKILIPFEKELTENLYVQEGRIEDIKTIELDDLKVGFNICQDSWQALSQIRRFKHNPVKAVMDQEPDILINISCSPFYLGKTDDMIYNVLARISREHRIPVLYLGIVGLDGGQLVLGGYSQVLYNGDIYRHMKLFEEDEILIDLKRLHELPKTKKPQNMFSTVAQRKKHHFQSMNKAFQSVFHYLCLKHGIIENKVTLEDAVDQTCFKDFEAVQQYLEIVKQDRKIYAKTGFVFHFEERPASLLMTHILSISLPDAIKVTVVIVREQEIGQALYQLLEGYRFDIVQTERCDLIDTIDRLTCNEHLLPLDTFCFTDYMLGKIPHLIFGLAPLGSLSCSLVHEMLSEYDLVKYLDMASRRVDEQLVVDTILQSLLQNGNDFKSVLLKSFPVYYDFMSRFGEISEIAESFLEYLLDIYNRYHNAMNLVSNRINPRSIIQLTWYSPNRYRYVNHSLSVNDWYIRAAFESIRPQLENW